MRIASLLASGTEIVFDLGLGDQLVGISHECDYPPEALSRPRLSRPRFDPAGLTSGQIDAAVRDAMQIHRSVYEVDAARLAELRPDLILAQAVCEVCAVPTALAAAVVQAMPVPPRVLSLDAHRVGDVFDGVVSVARAAGVESAGIRRAGDLRARIESVSRRVAGRGHPRVLALEWLDPPFVPGHWTPEMIALAGGESIAGDVGRPSRQVTWDAIGETDPDVLVVMPCGFGLAQAVEDAGRVADRLMDIAPRAVESGRAFVVDGSAYFNRSGPRVATGVEILGALLHPAAFPDAGLAGKAVRWESAMNLLSKE